jgi:hypothetical protein
MGKYVVILDPVVRTPVTTEATEGREVVALTEATASIRNPVSGSLTLYRKNHPPSARADGRFG